MPQGSLFARPRAPGARLGTPSDRRFAIEALTFQLLCGFLEISAAEQPKCDFDHPPWFWLDFASHVVAKYHIFGLMGLTWDSPVADLGQPRTQLFDFLVPWGRLGATKTSFCRLWDLARTNLDPIEVLNFRLWVCLGTALWARVGCK